MLGAVAPGWVAPAQAFPLVVDLPPTPYSFPQSIAQTAGGPKLCDPWTVQLRTRGGLQVVDELDYFTARIRRNDSDISESSTDLNTRCSEPPRAWVHEIAVFAGRREIWCGPFIDKESQTLRARDLAQWLERRVLPKNRFLLDREAASAFVTLVEDAMEPDPSPNLLVSWQPTNFTVTRRVVASELVRAGDALRELARTGLNWTMMGRRLVVGDFATLYTPLVLDDSAVISATADLPGLELATDWIVQGNRNVLGRATEDVTEFGLLQTTSSEDSILDNPSADDNALNRLRESRLGVTRVEAKLKTDSGLGWDELVPGRLVDTRLDESCDVPVDALLKLVGVNAETRSGKVPEVSVTLEAVLI